MARELGADVFVVECRLSPETTRKRLLSRLGEVSASDGRWEIFEKQTGWFEPIDELPGNLHVLIDTSKPLLQNIRQVLDRIG
jgi:predicted kinase